MSAKEAAKYLGVAHVTIMRLIDRGSIKATKFGPAWMIDKDSLDDYAERNREKNPHDPTRG